MNIDLSNLLASRADAVDPPAFDPALAIARGERRIRRRNRGVAAGAALTVALSVGVAVLFVNRNDDNPAPADPSSSWELPLTYGEGQTLHLGDREIDTGLDFLSIDVTGEGAVLTTLDGGIWFTDGTTVERIGSTGKVGRSSGLGFNAATPSEWVTVDNAGPLLAWIEYPNGRRGVPELVVYDAKARRVLARNQIQTKPGNGASVVAVVGQDVYLAEDYRGVDVSAWWRYAVGSSELQQVTFWDVETARQGGSGPLVVDSSAESGRLLHQDGLPGEPEPLLVRVRESRLAGLFDPRTGDRVEMALPASTGLDELWFTQWLDDDRFSLVSLTKQAGHTRDLFVCRISTSRCDIAVTRADWEAQPLLPGFGGEGASLAEEVAWAQQSGAG